MTGLLEWHFTDGGWLQVVDIRTVRDIQEMRDWGRAGSSSVSFVVASLTDQLALFEANGIRVGKTFETKGSLRTATVTDPAGNLVTFVEELGAAKA
jgi:hypothetical protein